MDDLWSTDHQVLAAIVQAIEVRGQDDAGESDIAALDLDAAEARRSVRRLDAAGMIQVNFVFGGGWLVTEVTERGLREAGAWPDRADQLAAQLIAALAEAAEREPEPEKRSRLRKAATGVAGVGRDVLAEVLASYVAKMAGGA